MEAEKNFLDFDAINTEIQSWPLDDYEKQMIRKGKRRKFPISREETLLMIEAQRQYLAEEIIETRRKLLAVGVSVSQILIWENDPEGRKPWDIYAESETGKAELALRRKMDVEHYRRWREQNPNSEDVPF